MKNDAGIKARQQIIDKIKRTNNILVTVSRDPSVDELSAALSLTTILNKIGKHGTAIFSGAIPPAINFLNPEKVFEDSADSLRDFIIALDKEKADHLRYKIEGDVVKIFITPYHSKISSDDLDYSQGDYNVELVIALGVSSREYLDSAISAHGQMLHDADIMTLSAGDKSSKLGSVDWQDSNASCLCEMVANLGEALKSEKPILDKQIATALLTGIVAATDRFSNMFTSSRVMTVAAQLMAAGADQQLIAAKLQESHEVKVLDENPADVIIEKPDESANIAPSKSEDIALVAAEAPVPDAIVEEISTLPPGSLVVDHSDDNHHESDLVQEEVSNATPEPLAAESFDSAQISSDQTLSDKITLDQPQFSDSVATPNPSLDSYDNAPSDIPRPGYVDYNVKVGSATSEHLSEPTLGGTLNATTERAAEDTKRNLESDQNKTILSHSYLGKAEPGHDMPINSSVEALPTNDDREIFSNSPSTVVQPPMPDLPMPPAVPDFSTLPPQPFGQFEPVKPNIVSQTSSFSNPVNDDPGQFRIPSR